jgi:threonine/homoserine/homoserine lactone efflux protein
LVTKFMGTALFLVGLVLIIIAILSLLGLVEFQGVLERLLVFAGGVLLCLIGFYMARERSDAPD